MGPKTDNPSKSTVRWREWSKRQKAENPDAYNQNNRDRQAKHKNSLKQQANMNKHTSNLKAVEAILDRAAEESELNRKAVAKNNESNRKALQKSLMVVGQSLKTVVGKSVKAVQNDNESNSKGVKHDNDSNRKAGAKVRKQAFSLLFKSSNHAKPAPPTVDELEKVEIEEDEVEVIEVDDDDDVNVPALPISSPVATSKVGSTPMVAVSNHQVGATTTVAATVDTEPNPNADWTPGKIIQFPLTRSHKVVQGYFKNHVVFSTVAAREIQRALETKIPGLKPRGGLGGALGRLKSSLKRTHMGRKVLKNAWIMKDGRDVTQHGTVDDKYDYNSLKASFESYHDIFEESRRILFPNWTFQHLNEESHEMEKRFVNLPVSEHTMKPRIANLPSLARTSVVGIAMMMKMRRNAHSSVSASLRYYFDSGNQIVLSQSQRLSQMSIKNG